MEKLITRKDLAVKYYLSVKTIQRRISKQFKYKRYFTSDDLQIIHQLIIQKSTEN